MGETNEKKWSVYIHTNKTNNKVYIGITSWKPEDRWGHNGNRYYKAEQPVFYRAIQKYGWDGFEHIIFAENLSEEEAKKIEIGLIALYKSNCCRYRNPSYGYNMTDGGDGTKGRPHTDETKQKIREKATGRVWSEQQKEDRRKLYKNIKNPFSGRSHSDETKKIIGDKARTRLADKTNHPMYGKTQSEESINKNIQSQKTKKSVVQCDKQLNFITQYISINEASRKTGIPRMNISYCCHHKPHYNTAGGYIWMFKEEYDKLSKTLSRNDAIRARRNKEVEMFGYDNAPQQHLFEQCGITQQNDLTKIEPIENLTEGEDEI